MKITTVQTFGFKLDVTLPLNEFENNLCYIVRCIEFRRSCNVFQRQQGKLIMQKLKVIIHSLQSLLFVRDDVWVKKENFNFDVTMRSYDGTGLSKLTVLYMFNVLSREFGKKGIDRVIP